MDRVKNIFKDRYNDFIELEDAIKKLNNNNDAGDAMEYFAEFYFNYFNKLYCVDKVYPEKKIPKDIKEKLKLEETDNGVDGVIIRTDGKIVAYQVKFRSSRDGLTATELSTFWAESEYADQRIIISNCKVLPRVSNKKKHQSTVMLSDLLELDKAFFDELYNYYNNDNESKKIERIKYKPREYQQNLINKVIEGFETHDRGKLIAACGTGKTLMALWLQEQMCAKRILYVVPSLALIKQTLEEWSIHANEDFDFLCVCSDSSVVGNDDIVVDASVVNFPVSTNSEDVANFIANTNEKKKIVFSTYNSLDVIVSALMSESESDFDLGIFDESHRTAGTKSSRMFIYGLDDEYIRIEKRLFMTATERLVTPRVKKHAEQLGDVIFSMDDEEKYGPVFASLNFGDAIQKNIISDYKIVLVSMNEKSLMEYRNLRKINSVEIGDDNKQIDKKVLMKQLILNKVIKEIGIKKILSYHAYVKNAKIFIEGSDENYSLEDILEGVFSTDEIVFTGHVNGEMNASERKEILKDFEKSELGIVSNARCLTEGVDVPVIDAVYFADPKNSMVDIVQAVGRSLRKSPKKATEYSYVVIPFLISDDIEEFSDIPENNFSTIHNVVQAMRMQDKRLADEIDVLNMNIVRGGSQGGYRGGSGLPSLEFIPYDKISIEDFSDNINLRIATYNKDVDPNKPDASRWKEKDARKSEVKRVFVSIGDYNLETYKESLIIPTLDKYVEDGEIVNYKENKDLKVNHNNVSHTKRFGAIQKEGRKYKITQIGKSLLQNNYSNYEDIAKRQILYYYSVDNKNNKILYPYRTILKVLLETNYLTRLEFLYCVYSLRSTDLQDVKKAVENVEYIRETFPRIDYLNTKNKEKALEILNVKLGVDFAYKDIWTSRTTTYNQYNYFKKHLLYFDDIFIDNDKNKIEININKKDEIKRMLLDTVEIEECNIDKEIDEGALLEKYVSL